MKKITFLLFITISLFSYQNRVAAQVTVGASINISSQPIWGPAGYDYAEYYYMPDIDAYYYVPERRFVYRENNRWRFAASLPGRFHYNLYNGYKVVVNEPKPYLHAEIYRGKYGKYKGWNGKQSVIRDSRDKKYYVIKGHPMHGGGNAVKHHDNKTDKHHDNGNNGHGNDKNKHHKPGHKD